MNLFSWADHKNGFIDADFLDKSERNISQSHNYNSIPAIEKFKVLKWLKDSKNFNYHIWELKNISTRIKVNQYFSQIMSGSDFGDVLTTKVL